MGTSSVPQEQQVREKVQKGWLSRWTRKQWSRHWFVLKNGSITYYRGPAAELCSFLDGVLDLSLIKHIEVPQQVEKARPALTASSGSQNYAFNYQQNLSQYHQQQQQQQQQQVNSRFDFTLKMWNGECHLLSATSAAERQSWLAAIHSCGSFDDSTSDSSASSDSSMSAKSTDIGKASSSSHVGTARNSSNSATSTSSAASQTHSAFLNSYQSQQQQEREAELSLEQLAFRLKSVVRRNNAGRYQEQEAVVERPSEQKQQQQQQNSSQVRDQQQTKPTSQTRLLKQVFCTQEEPNRQNEEHDQSEQIDGSEKGAQQLDQMEDQEREAQPVSERAEHQAHKRNLNSPKSTSEPKLLKRDGEARQKNTIQRPVGGSGGGAGDDDEEAEMLSIKSDASSGLSAGGLEQAQPTAGLLKSSSNGQQGAKEQPAAMQRQKKRVTFDLSNQDLSKFSRIERDLSCSSASSSSGEEESCSSSPSSSSDEAEDEPEAQQPNSNDTKPRAVAERVGSVARSSPDSISSLSSSSDSADHEPSAPSIDNSNDKTISSSSNEGAQLEANANQLLDLDQIREIEQRRKLEFKRQLSYSSQKANDEDEDSTCELVRRMIERRKLRLLNKQQQQREVDEAPAEGPCELGADANVSSGVSRTDHSIENSSATSSCQMETNEDLIEHKVDSSSSSNEKSDERNEFCRSQTGDQIDQLKQLSHINQLEDRLKSAQFNIEHLERRLNDSYLSYNQLELSYNQLQVKLVECQQMHANSLMQTQSKIDELSRELEASELKLLEAKEKLLKYEEHLAKWQQQSQLAADAAREPNSTTSSASSQPQQRYSGASRWAHQKTSSWLMKNSSYLAAAHHNLASNQIGSHLIASQHQEQVHQPLLLMHQLKQTLSINQQQLSLKLLNQSKQIQRKLNELESKVDRIQATDCKHFAARLGGQANLSPAASDASAQ